MRPGGKPPGLLLLHAPPIQSARLGRRVALGLGDFGPYEPQVAFPGSLAETDKLKAWVAALPR